MIPILALALALALAAPAQAMPDATPLAIGGDLITRYGPFGAFGAVLLIVLTALYRLNEKARAADADRLTDQLKAVERISTLQQETAKQLNATITAASLVTAKLDDLVRDLRELTKEQP